MVLVRELTDYLYGSKEYLSTCIKIPEFPIISWVLVVIIVSFNKILYCHNILKLPDTKHCSRHFFPLHCSLSARKLSRLFHHRNPPLPHSLQRLGSSPVSSQHYPENRNFVYRQRDSRRGFSLSGCLHHYTGTLGGTKLRRKNACIASDSKLRAASCCYGPCLSPAEIKSPVFCAFPWWLAYLSRDIESSSAGHRSSTPDSSKSHIKVSVLGFVYWDVLYKVRKHLYCITAFSLINVSSVAGTSLRNSWCMNVV